MDWKSEIQSWKMGGMLKVSQCPHLREGRMGGAWGEEGVAHLGGGGAEGQPVSP